MALYLVAGVCGLTYVWAVLIEADFVYCFYRCVYVVDTCMTGSGLPFSLCLIVGYLLIVVVLYLFVWGSI